MTSPMMMPTRRADHAADVRYTRPTGHRFIPMMDVDDAHCFVCGKHSDHFAEHDDTNTPEAIAGLEARLTDLGKEVRIFTYPGTAHAFFNDTRPEVFEEDAARQAWVRTLEFLRAKLG